MNLTTIISWQKSRVFVKSYLISVIEGIALLRVHNTFNFFRAQGGAVPPFPPKDFNNNLSLRISLKSYRSWMGYRGCSRNTQGNCLIFWRVSWRVSFLKSQFVKEFMATLLTIPNSFIEFFPGKTSYLYMTSMYRSWVLF